MVATKPRSERIAHAALHHRGYKPYLPLLLGKPLFSRYLFIQLGQGQPWYPIAWAPGVYSLLQTDGKPAHVNATLVEAIRAGEALRSIPTTSEHLYRPGAACEASLGGGSKVDAVVVAVAGQKATILAIMLGALREIEVGLDNLRSRDT